MTCNFLTSWKESLALLVIPRQITLFSLVTLKAFMRTMSNLIFRFWWLIGLCLMADMTLGRFFRPTIWGAPLLIMWICIWLLWIFVVYLTVRPSTKIKWYFYYSPYWYFYFIFAAFVFVSYVFITCIGFGVEHLLLKSSIELYTAARMYTTIMQIVVPLFSCFVPSSFIPFFLSPFASFYMFFVLDSDGSIKSIIVSLWRAFKMVFLNYPFCLITLIIFLISYNLVDALEAATGVPFMTISMFVAIPFIQCIYANFYTKRLHDQFACYFPQTVKG